jgi:FkbM family methyltransferase
MLFSLFILLLINCFLVSLTVNATSMTAEDVQQIKNTILAKAQAMQTWTATDMHLQHPEVKSFKLRKNRGITQDEVIMMQQIVRRLTNDTISNTFNVNTFTHGQFCTHHQRKVQAVASKHAGMTICSEESAYKIAHLGFPKARTFIDVGCNKGYTSALIAGLWQGHSSGLSPYLLFLKYEELKVFQSALSPAGYCRTGLDRAYPLHCPAVIPSTTTTTTATTTGNDKAKATVNRHQDGQCDVQLQHPDASISIYAIDGSSTVANTLRNTLQQMTPLNKTTLANNIQVFHLAMSDKTGTVKFLTIEEDSASGFEGGSIIGKRKLLSAAVNKNRHHHHHHQQDKKRLSEIVTMTTLNSFTTKHHIQNKVDFIKIDAEGHDLDVIKGANETLGSVGILMWEQNSQYSRDLVSIIQQLEHMHFECYIPGKSGFVKLTHGCFQISRIPKGNNIVCASRVHAPGAVLAFDLLSLYHDDVDYSYHSKQRSQ